MQLLLEKLWQTHHLSWSVIAAWARIMSVHGEIQALTAWPNVQQTNGSFVVDPSMNAFGWKSMNQIMATFYLNVRLTERDALM